MSQRMDVPALRGNAPATPYRVLSQVESFDQGPTGQVVRGMRVTFQLQSGTTATVFVPEGGDYVSAVQAAILQKAGQLAAVERLGQ